MTYSHLVAHTEDACSPVLFTQTEKIKEKEKVLYSHILYIYNKQDEEINNQAINIH